MIAKDADGNPIYYGNLETDQLVEFLHQQVEEEIEDRKGSGYYELLRRSYNTYYGLDDTGTFFEGTDLTSGGSRGELTKIKINVFRNLIQHVIVMTIADRPAFDVQAVNTDAKSLKQTMVAKSILEYYLHARDIENHLYRSAEMSQVRGEGYVSVEWDPNAGRIVSGNEETGEPIYSGDLEVCSFGPLDVFRDKHAPNNNPYWRMTRRWVNRWDLIARFPDLTEKLVATESKKEILSRELGMSDTTVALNSSRQDTDLIPLYRWFHKATPAVPNGRLVEFVSGDIYIGDGPMPYKEIPIYRIAPSEILDGPYGYSNAFSMLSSQQARDALDSTVLSSLAAFGVQLVWSPTGGDVQYDKLSSGLSMIRTPPNMKPEALQLTSIPPEALKMREMFETGMENIMGVSSVTRGDPKNSLRTGSSLAMVQAMSVQFNSGFQRSWAKLLEAVGSGILNVLKAFADQPQMVTIVGKNKETFLLEFTKDDLEFVDRVYVRLGSALSYTAAGKAEAASELLQQGSIKDPATYFQIRESGNLETVMETSRPSKLLVDYENEKLRAGESCIVLPTDQHMDHLNEHNALLSEPAIRNDPQVATLITQHMQEHIEVLKTADPNLLMYLGIQPMMPPPPEGAPPGGALPEGVPPDTVPSENAPGTEAMPAMPSGPENPATGQEVPVPT